MYTLVKDAKAHLNIDADFHDDDALVLEYIQAAEAAVERHLDRPLKDCLENGRLRPNLRQAILLLIGNYYANRESVTYGRPAEVPYTLKYLLSLDKRYSVG